MSNLPKITTKPKADTDFEKELWDTVNERRGAMAENQYKDHVLSLLFVKHLSECYQIRRQEIQLALFYPISNYYTTRKKEQNLALEDELESISFGL